MNNFDLKDLYGETRTFSGRALVFWFVLIFLTLLLVARMFYLQVVQYDRYTTLSNKNRVLLQPIAPNRGLIYDRNARLLAENTASHSVTITKEHTPDIEQTIATISEIISVSERDRKKFMTDLKQRRRPYQSVPLRYRLTEEEIAKLAVNAHRLPGVSVEAQLVRHYPLKDSTAHVLGYVGRINEQELKNIDVARYAGTDSIGKLGVEKFYEAELLGQVGFQKVEINARGRVLRVLERSAPAPGMDLQLYLDARLQQVAEQALGDKRGAVVAIDTETGGILVMVSNPSFNPNLFVTGIDFDSYAELRDSPDLPLFNRAIRGQYPPGSTLKPFVALAGLELGYINWEHTIYDPGWLQLTKGGRYYRDWKKWGHGRVNLETAIVQSCDTYFYEMAQRMNVDAMHDFIWQFGFGQQTGRDIGEALKGVLPSSDWKKNSLGQSWYRGDSLNLSIGQGYMLATPLQLATATAVLANRGRWLQPHLVKQIKYKDGEDKSVDKTVQKGSTERDLTSLGDMQLKNGEDWEKIIHAMELVVHGEHGTARKTGQGAQYKMAGKTGTAQVIGIKQDEEYDEKNIAERNKDHGLFIAFAPVKAPKIAIAIIVENGGGGSTAAAPVARKILDAYLVEGSS